MSKHDIPNLEHLFISDLRANPDAEVRLHVNGKLVCGTRPGQVVRSIDAMLAEAWDAGAEAQAKCYGMDKDTGTNPYRPAK